MSQSQLKEQRSSYIDFINVIATIAVITLHTNYNKCYSGITPGSVSWYISCALQCLCSFAVPCFFMISGATLLDFPEKYSMKEYFVKRFYKCVIPFVVWSFMALFFSLLIKTVKIDDLTICGVINSILNTKYNENYWFLTTLFGVYLSIPLFAYIPREKKRMVFLFVAITAFFLNAAIPDFIKILQIPLKWNIRVTAISPYLLYVLIGYLINSDHEPFKRRNGVIYTVALVSMIIIIVYTIRQTLAAGSLQNALRSNGSATLIMVATGFFLFMKNNAAKFLKSQVLRKIIFFLRDYSFGVYLTHWFVRLFLVRVMGANEYSIYYCIFGPWLIMAICVLLIWIIRKIPWGRYIIP